MARTRFIQAINDALHEEMQRDDKVILFGEDVEASIFGDTRGLIDTFGPRRVRNTPICENTLTGMAVGTAANGYRVVLHMMFANFIYTGFDGIANQMARLRLMSGGQVQLPITIIASYSGGRSNAAQHSDTPFAPLMNLGGFMLPYRATRPTPRACSSRPFAATTRFSSSSPPAAVANSATCLTKST